MVASHKNNWQMNTRKWLLEFPTVDIYGDVWKKNINKTASLETSLKIPVLLWLEDNTATVLFWI